MTTDGNPPLADSPQTAGPAPQPTESTALADSAPCEQPPAEPHGSSRSLLPDDLRVPWDWVDILLLVLMAIGESALIGFLIFAVLRVLGISPTHIRKSPDAMDMMALVAQILLDLGLLAYLAAQMRLRFHAPFWRAIGWRPIETRSVSRTLPYSGLVLGGFLLAAAVTFAEGLFPPKHTLPIETMTSSPHAALLFMITAVLVAPVVEETIFRGYLYPVAARSFGIGWGIFITGTLFGLLHAGQLWGGWWQITLLVIVGIVFTAARAVSRTVVASYILHASYNALPVIATLFSSLRLRHPVPLH